MSGNTVKLFGSAVEFQSFGKSSLAYVRQMSAEDLNNRFPEVVDWPLGEDLWALFGADGHPIAVADHEGFLQTDAQERDLLTVSVQ